MRPSRRIETDEDLACLALAGNRGALAELLARHWDTAVFLAARVLGSPELARDAAQEAAIAAMTDLERLRSFSKFGPWFCGIALNVARRWLRQLKSEVPGVLPDWPSSALDPAEAAEIADVAARVRDAIGALAEGQREAVLLFYLQGLSHREVAAELGISPSAVKARLHQARAALAPKLAHMIEFPEERVMTTTNATQWIDVDVREIRRGPGDDPWQRKHVMILAERGGDRRLPMWIGPAEATMLAMILEAAETPRPFTYKLAASLVTAAGAQIEGVRITQLLAGVFYASVTVRGATGLSEVDARPSDAVNLALASGAPIRVDSELMERATPSDHAEELATYPVATADIADEAMERLREHTR